MKLFDPTRDVKGAAAVLESDGSWPNFHDAIVYSLNFWRGDMRPDDDVWISPTIDASLELAALEVPFVVDFRFHGCCYIRMGQFDHNNDIYDLTFSFEGRGCFADGVTPLPPYICVALENGPAREPLLTFKCFHVEILASRPVPDPPCR